MNTLKETIVDIKSNYKYQENDEEIIGLIDSLFIKLDKINEEDFKNIDFSLSLLYEPNIY